MNKISQENNEQKMWDAAIEDTERQLREVEGRIKSLKAAIGTYKAHRDAGLPWPVNEKAGIDSASIPA